MSNHTNRRAGKSFPGAFSLPNDVGFIPCSKPEAQNRRIRADVVAESAKVLVLPQHRKRGHLRLVKG